MGSEFKKLINQVFGERAYARYRTFVKNNFRRKSTESRNVYNDIYKHLKPAQESILKAMLEHLESVMYSVVRICKTYFIAVIVYAAAVAILLWLGNTPMVKLIGIGLLSIAFLYKSYEFFINKYCYVDARIAITYKNVLEQLLKEAEAKPKIEPEPEPESDAKEY